MLVFLELLIKPDCEFFRYALAEPAVPAGAA